MYSPQWATFCTPGGRPSTKAGPFGVQSIYARETNPQFQFALLKRQIANHTPLDSATILAAVKRCRLSSRALFAAFLTGVASLSTLPLQDHSAE